jgi:hypothetical protein
MPILTFVVEVCKHSICRYFVIFDVISLFINVPVDEVLQVIRNELHNDDTLAE